MALCTSCDPKCNLTRKRKEATGMAKQIPWETNIEVALDRGTKEQKPIFVDFWFDG